MYEKGLHHTLLLVVFKIVKAFSVSLSQSKTVHLANVQGN